LAAPNRRLCDTDRVCVAATGSAGFENGRSLGEWSLGDAAVTWAAEHYRAVDPRITPGIGWSTAAGIARCKTRDLRAVRRV
jgi:hypothetical protein